VIPLPNPLLSKQEYIDLHHSTGKSL
jgi:hypothetical protein